MKGYSHLRGWIDRLTPRIEYLDDYNNRNKLFGLVLFLPALVFLTVFILLPIGYIFWLSLHEMSLLSVEGEFVGLENYRYLLTNPDVHEAFRIGAVYAVGTVTFQLVIGLFLALILNKQFRGSSLIRTLAILPYLVPVIAVVLMWRWMANPTYGVINEVALSVGLWSDPINFFGSPTLAMPALIIGSSWKFISFCVLVFLARLQAIDDAQYEQAKISGAGHYQMFRTITLPNLWNVILLVVLLRLIWMFNKFAEIWLFTRGGPLGRTTTFPVFIYETTFLDYDLGVGSAAAILLFVILSGAAMLYFWYFKPSQEIETAR